MSPPIESGILFPLKSKVWQFSQFLRESSKDSRNSNGKLHLLIANVSKDNALLIHSERLLHESLLKLIPQICKRLSLLFKFKFGFNQ